MAPSTKLEDKLEGLENFQAWKYRIGLILKENGLEKYIKVEIVEPKEDDAKENHEQDLLKAMMIIANYIKDHLIPQVSSKKTPKNMYDALSRMYEGRNINRNINLRAQLKGTKLSKGESIKEYFTRVSQFREPLSAIGHTLDEDELVMNALNDLTRPWDSFIQTLCARKESMKYGKIGFKKKLE